MAIRGFIVALLAGHAVAQTIGDAPATPANVAPAATAVPDPPTKKEAASFSWESQQLTPEVVANLTDLDLTDIELFDFAKDNAAARGAGPQCKAFPGDANYPGPIAWKVLDLLTGGAVIKTVPLAAPCYQNWPEYNPAECARINASWSDPHLHVADPSSNMWPLYEGLTCLPPGLRAESNNCTLGGYASYSVNISNIAQIQLALNFARNTNIRLVVMNTGHDFADKSLGAGALSIWTHQLRDIKFIKDYSYGSYKGPAFKLGAGAMTENIYRAAEENGVTAVGGVCRTVGLPGGYIAGGGHSPMISMWGMGADQVLSMEVVLPNGRFVTASKDQNPDLFWALRGGGGSTYGVVTSVVIRVYPKVPITTLTFNFTQSETVSADQFWKGIRAFFSYFAPFADAGAYNYWTLGFNGVNGSAFSMNPFWGANMTQPQLEALMAPFFADLARIGIATTPIYTQYPSLYPAWQANYPPEMVGGFNNHAASRLFPRDNFVGDARIDETTQAVRTVIEDGGFLVGYNLKSAKNPQADQDNSVNTAWRKTLTHFILVGLWDNNSSWDEIAAVSEKLTNDWMAKWRAVSPGGGAYMSEADINEPNFQQAFYGDNYSRLYALKQQYDPTGLFYAPTAVGSENWYITNQHPYIPTQNGKLCRK